jgi:hypothetical protein
MTNDEFETWDNFLQHAVNKALDYGVDASAVLDRVAEIVSENPCPAFASSTRVADLLLTHLDMADVRQLPSYIFDFVNDTLQSTYPPAPRNKVMSIWMVRSLIRVVDACPAELRLNLLETLQEGISLWISDEFRVFNEDEYTGDVLPLYQTALLVTQELPRSLYVLDTLSTLIGSVFHGRNDKPSVAHESFEEFWQITFAHHEEPEGGWPQKIQAYIKWSAATSAVEDMPEDIPQVDESGSESSSDSLGSDDIQYPSSQTSPELDLPFGSDNDDFSLDHITSEDCSPLVGRLGPAFFPTLPTEALETDSPLFPSLSYPTTPTQRQNRAETPPRPQKPSTTPESFHSLLLRSPASTLPLLSSISPSTPRRPVVKSEKTPCSISPGKRRMLEDKENMSPILSVVQRISSSSPGKEGASFMLGNRQTLDEPYGDEVTKNGRTACGTFIRSSIGFPSVDEDSDLEDELVVATSLLSPSRSSNLASSPAIHASRKRKRVVMDAVVLPPFQEIQIGWRLQRRASLEQSFANTPTKVMRRTHSLPVLSDSERDGSEDDRRKRMRLWDDSEATDQEEHLSSSPLKALEDMQMAGSGECKIDVDFLACS